MASPQAPIILIDGDYDNIESTRSMRPNGLQRRNRSSENTNATISDLRPQALVQEGSSDSLSICIPFALYKESSLYKYRLHENHWRLIECPEEPLRISEVVKAKERNGKPEPSRFSGSSAGLHRANRAFGSPASCFSTNATSRPKLIAASNPVELASENYSGVSHSRPQPFTLRQRAQGTANSSPDTLVGDDNNRQTKSPKDPSPQAYASVVPEGAEVIDIDDDDQYVVIQDEDDDPEVVVISDSRFPNARPIRLRNAPASGRRKSSQPKIIELRNPPIALPFTCLETYAWPGKILRPNLTVELRNGDFLRIRMIISNPQTREVKLRGDRLKRTNFLEGRLPEIDNELCFVYDVDLDDERSHEEQGAGEVLISDILRVRKIRVTNESFDAASTIDGLLSVRWKYTRTFVTASDRIKGSTEKEWALERLQASELPKDTIPDDKRRANWRGRTVPGGAYRPSLESRPENTRKRKEACYDEAYGATSGNLKRPRARVDLGSGVGERSSCINLAAGNATSPQRAPSNLIDLTEDPKPAPSLARTAVVADVTFSNSARPTSPIRRLPGQTYTYGDMFCGAGGTTRGASMAGLRVKYGVDSFNHACETWLANFPYAVCRHMELCTFFQEVEISGENAIVDILHLSPPCQYFSRAHTVAGKDDDMNTASLFAVEQALKITRPRVATLEQTFSIIDNRFCFYFNALICQFTSLEYSVRWQIVQLAQLGLPQRRYRLIAIAACPGEILPRMPAATHADPRFPLNGLKPYATVNEALATIPLNAEDHDLDRAKFALDKCKDPYDGDNILPRAMTTSGGQNYHPGGKRDFTLREYAVLQGFPPAHVFKGKYIKKQIGNAVPPLVAKVLFESVKQQLEEADGVIDEGIVID
ncbi:uncharacterized protein BP5553_05882 [Venustampulla echinocandica]|uniref:DNA (cytosine-5-)-methyltransferase n=1 Tax=Venustampulla echinocandica TaxID=2656787 RepID=A0A370TLY3_9HELO|nr:uncharacterized protein BP5553_05882 [Venustampulla echinocandica]RDL36530.1 hypothetical protein BP5553_05882 [Venustampulla echinocandica]